MHCLDGVENLAASRNYIVQGNTSNTWEYLPLYFCNCKFCLSDNFLKEFPFLIRLRINSCYKHHIDMSCIYYWGLQKISDGCDCERCIDFISARFCYWYSKILFCPIKALMIVVHFSILTQSLTSFRRAGVSLCVSWSEIWWCRKMQNRHILMERITYENLKITF